MQVFFLQLCIFCNFAVFLEDNNNFNGYNHQKKFMKKYTLVCAALGAVMILSGCKSKESAYKQAYLKAKQQDEMQQQQQQVAQNVESNVVVPMQTKVATQTQVVDNADNVAVR